MFTHFLRMLYDYGFCLTSIGFKNSGRLHSSDQMIRPDQLVTSIGGDHMLSDHQPAALPQTCLLSNHSGILSLHGSCQKPIAGSPLAVRM